jgi:two-component system, chemotaxis family, protein-glutamate methylesterase/glutaminase
VQDPASAPAPDMPRHVLEKVRVDHVVHPLELPGLLVKLVAAPAGPTAEASAFVNQLEGRVTGGPAEIVCPICEGVLTEAQPGLFTHFRCHVGHAFTLDSLVSEQSEELERVLWAAIRALEESAALARRISLNEKGELRRRFIEKAETQQKQADYIRRLVLHGAALSQVDANAV